MTGKKTSEVFTESAATAGSGAKRDGLCIREPTKRAAWGSLVRFPR